MCFFFVNICLRVCVFVACGCGEGRRGAALAQLVLSGVLWWWRWHNTIQHTTHSADGERDLCASVCYIYNFIGEKYCVVAVVFVAHNLYVLYITYYLLYSNLMVKTVDSCAAAAAPSTLMQCVMQKKNTANTQNKTTTRRETRRQLLLPSLFESNHRLRLLRFWRRLLLFPLLDERAYERRRRSLTKLCSVVLFLCFVVAAETLRLTLQKEKRWREQESQKRAKQEWWISCWNRAAVPKVGFCSHYANASNLTIIMIFKRQYGLASSQ